MSVPAGSVPPVEAIELSVRLTGGGFESRIQMPVAATSDQRLALVSTWFKLIEQALGIAKSKKAHK